MDIVEVDVKQGWAIGTHNLPEVFKSSTLVFDQSRVGFGPDIKKAVSRDSPHISRVESGLVQGVELAKPE